MLSFFPSFFLNVKIFPKCIYINCCFWVFFFNSLKVCPHFSAYYCFVQSDPSVLAGSWTEHTDAVWGLAYSGIKNRLLSCSADGTVKLWNPTEKNPCISTFNTNKGKCGECPPPHPPQQATAGTATCQSLTCVCVCRARCPHIGGLQWL